MGTATINATQVTPTDFHYDITVANTGTTTIGTFWFSWVPGQDFMPVTPISVVSPAGWNEIVTHGGAFDGLAILPLEIGGHILLLHRRTAQRSWLSVQRHSRPKRSRAFNVGPGRPGPHGIPDPSP
jgi:hypothetical protein